jgi:hypothetical protein
LGEWESAFWENYKLQNTNYKQITNHKLQITNKEASFGQVLNACGGKREVEKRKTGELGEQLFN